MAITRQKALSKVFGDPQKKLLKKLEKRVIEINALGPKYEKMTKKELQEQTEKLKKSLTKKSVTLDTILPQAFALVREASTRVLGMRHFDVQMIGGMSLWQNTHCTLISA